MSVSIQFALLKLNVETILLKNETPPQKATVLRCRGLQPGKGIMVRLYAQFGASEITLQSMNGPHNASALLF